jgi:uncharacterized protein (TIGR01440 family)
MNWQWQNIAGPSDVRARQKKLRLWHIFLPRTTVSTLPEKTYRLMADILQALVEKALRNGLIEMKNDNLLTGIRSEVENALNELIRISKLEKEQIILIGCSTSEVQGKRIGTFSSSQIAEAIFSGLIPSINRNRYEVFLAFQCCEHLNRCVVVEKSCAIKYGLEIVDVVPQLKAGGGMATFAYQTFKQPVVVEKIKAHAGMDIGDTLIGMHLKSVAVPVRIPIKSIGTAHLTLARTRPKFIGGSRALYQA